MDIKQVFEEIEARPQGTKIVNAIDPELWVWYIQQARDLTGERILVKKCVKCVIRAHGFLKDYYSSL